MADKESNRTYSFKKSRFQRMIYERKTMYDKTPNFFIVGAPKCGTTAMHIYLRQHPEIFMPEKKESHFFGSDLNSQYFIRDREKYLSLFSEAKDVKRIGEASVWYLYSKQAAYEIKEFSPSASIIIMLRNPVDMLYAQHSQFLYNGNENIASFEDALNAEKTEWLVCAYLQTSILLKVSFTEKLQSIRNRFGGIFVFSAEKTFMLSSMMILKIIRRRLTGKNTKAKNIGCLAVVS